MPDIEIPAWCQLLKPWYFRRPDQALVREIKAFIKEDGRPYMWPGGTYTKPPDGARIEYLGEFDLPEKHQYDLAPCPCCSPTAPKYKFKGKIAWFPDEGVIRIIGPECYASRDPEGHAAAYARLQAEERRRRDIAYLISRLPTIPSVLRTLGASLDTIRALDAASERMPNTIDRVLQTTLWNHVRTGALTVNEQHEETYIDKDDEPRSRRVEIDREYGRIDGFAFLKPNRRAISPRIESVMVELRAIISADNVEERVANMSDERRREIADIMRHQRQRARELIAEAQDLQRFFSAVTIATLRGWGRHVGCPIQIYAAIERGILLIGRYDDQVVRIPIPPAVLGTVNVVPGLNELMAAE
jgi:hypothetical protein